MVPLDSTLRLAGRLRGRTDLVILPGGDHSSAQGSESVDRLTIEWLLAHGKAGAPRAPQISARTART